MSAFLIVFFFLFFFLLLICLLFGISFGRRLGTVNFTETPFFATFFVQHFVHV